MVVVAVPRSGQNLCKQPPRRRDLGHLELHATRIGRHMIEDGEDSVSKPHAEDIYTLQVIRKRLAITQEQFARALRIPVATLCDWEQGLNSIDPAALTACCCNA